MKAKRDLYDVFRIASFGVFAAGVIFVVIMLTVYAGLNRNSIGYIERIETRIAEILDVREFRYQAVNALDPAENDGKFLVAIYGTVDRTICQDRACDGSCEDACAKYSDKVKVTTRDGVEGFVYSYEKEIALYAVAFEVPEALFRDVEKFFFFFYTYNVSYARDFLRPLGEDEDGRPIPLPTYEDTFERGQHRRNPNGSFARDENNKLIVDEGILRNDQGEFIMIRMDFPDGGDNSGFHNIFRFMSERENKLEALVAIVEATSIETAKTNINRYPTSFNTVDHIDRNL